MQRWQRDIKQMINMRENLMFHMLNCTRDQNSVDMSVNSLWLCTSEKIDQIVSNQSRFKRKKKINTEVKEM